MLRLVLTLMVGFPVAGETILVPAFSDNIPGAFGSRWISELRVYNPTHETHVVSVVDRFPHPGTNCRPIESVAVPAGGMVRLASLGCEGGSTAAMIEAPNAVVLESVLTAVAGDVLEECCPSGFGTHIRLRRGAQAFTTTREIANINVSSTSSGAGGLRYLNRHNLGLVNPNETPIVVRLRYFDHAGREFTENRLLTRTEQVIVPARTVLQVNDIFPTPQIPVTQGLLSGLFRVLAESTQPFDAYVASVDNSTNDALLLQ